MRNGEAFVLAALPLESGFDAAKRERSGSKSQMNRAERSGERDQKNQAERERSGVSGRSPERERSGERESRESRKCS